MSLAAISLIGDRTEQQDRYGYALNELGCLAVICDGMGGLRAGGRAAELGVQALCDESLLVRNEEEIPALLIQKTIQADKRIFQLKDEAGSLLGAGSTIVTAAIRNNQLFWCSAGDSRGYLFRDGNLVQFTQDQNYRTVLTEQQKAGVISEDQLREESKKGDALINYLGIGRLSLLDYSQKPFPLRKGDRILLCTDGLYRLAADSQMEKIFRSQTEGKDILQGLEETVSRSAAEKGTARDNMTAVILTIKQTIDISGESGRRQI